MTKYILIVFSIVLSSISSAQPKRSDINTDDDLKIKKRLEQLFEQSKKKQYQKASDAIAYKGSDTTRKLADNLHFDAPDEKSKVIEICDAINELLHISTGFRFDQFYMQHEKGKNWYYWRLLFQKTDFVDTVYFGFVKSKKGYLLGSIN
jgi:hypothetical protein